jgi:hypothetical protein
MFYLNILQNQWLILALLGGVGLMLLFVLFYWPFWSGRDQAQPNGVDGQPTAATPHHRYMPWVLVVLYLATVIYALVYVFQNAAQPPNW